MSCPYVQCDSCNAQFDPRFGDKTDYWRVWKAAEAEGWVALGDWHYGAHACPECAKKSEPPR